MNWICRTGLVNNWSYGYGGGLVMMLFWVAIIIGVIYLVKNFAPNRNLSSQADTPLALVKERYAKGEITDEDFERIKNKLREK